MGTSGLLPVGLGLLVTALTLAVPLVRWRWQRREKPPVTEKRLRQPGERLRHRLEQREDQALWLVLGTATVPLALLLVGVAWAPRLSTSSYATALTISAYVLFVGTLAVGAWRILRTFEQRRDVRRALNGERTVAEYLATLVPAGYRVYHDVPTDARQPEETIHHVVIGPAGVFAIHTQTHALRKALPGRKDHEILFDGDQLVYPWGQDTQGIVPARKRAEWLSDWLFQIVGERIPVAPVLTFPGWWVTPMTQRDVRVYNPGQIAALIQQSAAARLTENQSGLILRQLEDRCRDVEI